jgi:hypothetical protein
VSATFPATIATARNVNFVNPVTITGNKNAYDNKISVGINYHFGSI